MMPLSTQQQGLIREASRNVIQDGFECLREFWQAGEWLPDSNPYKKDCINELKRTFPEGVTNIECHQLVEYIAASTVTHCFDGWSFLGRALMQSSLEIRCCKTFGLLCRTKSCHVFTQAWYSVLIISMSLSK